MTDKKQITLRIDDELYKALQELKKKKGWNEFIVRILWSLFQ